MAGLAELLLGKSNPITQFVNENQNKIRGAFAGFGAEPGFNKSLSNAALGAARGGPLDDIAAEKRQMSQQQADAKNKTVAYLRAQPGGQQFADAIESGAIDGATAFKSWLDASKATEKPPQNPYMSAGDGKFFNWQTGEYVTDPNAAPDPKALAADAKAAAAQGRRDTATQTITDAAATARKLAGSGDNTGLAGAAWAMNPETDAAELRRQVEVLKSNASIENLTAMRQASPTGGALGSVTERENAMLAAAAGAIDPNAKKEDFVRALDNYELTLLQIIHGPQAGKQIFDQTRDGGEYVPQSSGGVDPISAADALLNSGKY